jgi:5-methyltetrahydrofolate--homocysteine methyltransferase
MTIDAWRARTARGPLVLDGAMATFLHASAGGASRVAATDALTLSQPAIVRGVHDAYLGSGADIVRTNTFRAASRPYAAGGRDLCLAAARLARAAADAWSLRTPWRRRFVAGAVGPADPDSEPGRDRQATAERLRQVFRAPLIGLLEGGVDLLLFETWWSPSQTESALRAFADACDASGRRVPVLMSTALAPDGRVAASGVSLAEWLDAIDPATVDGVGVNCGAGPGGLAAPLAALGSRSWLVSCAPSAGASGAAGGDPLDPGPFAQAVAAYAAAGLVDIAGGCCGTTPAHIRALAAAMAPTGADAAAASNVVATPRRAGTQ